MEVKLILVKGFIKKSGEFSVSFYPESHSKFSYCIYFFFKSKHRLYNMVEECQLEYLGVGDTSSEVHQSITIV